jgi:hypothetical protein
MKFDKEKLLTIDHTGSPLLVTAGLGNGKTRVITERILGQGMVKGHFFIPLAKSNYKVNNYETFFRTTRYH